MKSSMPRKSEVDLQVAQQLKNQTDFIYETNQKLQSHGQGLIAMSVLIEKLRTQSDNDKKWLLVSFENLREDILVRCYDMNQRLGNFETSFRDFQKKIDNFYVEFSKKYAFKKDVDLAMEIQSEESDDLSTHVSNRFDYFDNAVSDLRAYVKSQIDSVRQDLTPMIPDEDPIQKALDERFSTLSVDLDGFKTEIARLKKDLSYDQKKFENLYTLIERLQKGAH